MGEVLWVPVVIGLIWAVYAIAKHLGWLDDDSAPDTPEALFGCPECPHAHPDGPCQEIDDLGGWVSERCRCERLYAVP